MGDMGGGQDFGNMQDLFGDFFGDFFGGRGGGGGPRRARGRDLLLRLDLDFTEAVFGTVREVSIQREEDCGVCHSSGLKPGTQPMTCPTCRGSGQIRVSQGFFAIARTCSQCAGAGQIIKDPCEACKGRGRVGREAKLKVTVPAGVDEGNRLRLRGEGEAGLRGGPAGDLFVAISVHPHPVFVRAEEDLQCRVPISFVQAALGDEIEVPTLEGPTTLRIPEGTQTGSNFSFRGKGVPRLQSQGRGDLIVTVVIETPTRLNEKQRELLQAYAKEVGEEVHPQRKGFFDKVKDVFTEAPPEPEVKGKKKKR
jgi:molecular chaperone DnaJ